MTPYLRMIVFLLLASLSIIAGSLACDYAILAWLCKISWAVAIVAFLVTMVRSFLDDGTNKESVVR